MPNGAADGLLNFSSLQSALNCVSRKQRYQCHQTRTRAGATDREENQGTLSAIV